MEYCFQHLKGSCPKARRLVLIKVGMYMFMVGTIFLTVCGNLIVIISIFHFKQLHSPTNFLILSLGCVDCLLGALVMPLSMIRSIETCWYFGELLCKIHSSFDMMISMASIFHLSFIAIDRYYAICEPLRYKSKITIFVIAIFIGVSWLLSLGFAFGVVFSNVNIIGIEELVISNSCVGACVLIFNKQWGLLATLVAFLIPGIVMISLYMKIFLVARRHARLINNISEKDVSQNDNKNKVAYNRERKAARTLSIVMGVFLFCWLPFFIATLIDPFIDFSTPPILFDALVWFGYFNSTCNPIIYGLFYPWFQKAFKIIITGKIFCHNSLLLNLFPDSGV
ncbi:trace amine-associated receptor 4-like [Amia ocellicauda]|uniref:trace amine-associated receptor 4-like n=1 Tax=Amia ocellicauda TaxID=2972642 RepID=UPI0034649671